MIDGATRLFVIVGDPIAQVRSPLAFNARLVELGRNQVMLPWHVPAEAFAQVMAGLMRTRNLDGIVVTYPFKDRAMALADSVLPRAAQVGAVNAMRCEADGRWTADMFDGVGLIRAVASLAEDVRGRAVKLLGAGGAGSAIAFALAGSGASEISIYDVDAARAVVLADKVGRHSPSCRTVADGPDLGGATLLVNATPVGLHVDDSLPIPLADLTRATTVIDIVTRPDGTRLLEYARALGCPHLGGAAMVDGQREAILEFFRLATPTGMEHAA